MAGKFEEKVARVYSTYIHPYCNGGESARNHCLILHFWFPTKMRILGTVCALVLHYSVQYVAQWPSSITINLLQVEHS